MFKKLDACTDIAQVIERNTGMTIEEFRTLPDNLPYIENMQKAVDFIWDWCRSNPDEQITIVGDYDADGISATSIMYWIFTKMKWPRLKLRVPKRFSEGYGLSEKIIDEIPSGLVITVDNGITAFNAIKKAKEKGLAVIVTDHHLAPMDKDGYKVLPPADIVIDPAVDETSDCHDCCGAAVAYYLARALYPQFRFKELQSLAAIATVADVMPLQTGYNRKMVIEGLSFINDKKNVPGLNRLLSDMNANGHFDEEDIGFKIGPVFNASGRMFDSGANRVIRLLMSKRTDPVMSVYADALLKTNEDRKEKVKEIMPKALTMAGDKKPIVIYLPSCKEGLIGIIAGQLTEKYHCPSIVFTDAGVPGLLKGSGRSIDKIHLKNALDKIQDDIVGYGGHAGAAGLSIKKEMLSKFREDFTKAVGDIPNIPEDIYYDLELNPYLAACTAEELRAFAPFGQGNPKILFHMTVDLTNGSYRVIGDGTHFMINLEQPMLMLMGFGLKDRYEADGKPKKIECVGYLSLSWYNDKATPQFQIIDYLAV